MIHQGKADEDFQALLKTLKAISKNLYGRGPIEEQLIVMINDKLRRLMPTWEPENDAVDILNSSYVEEDLLDAAMDTLDDLDDDEPTIENQENSKRELAMWEEAYAKAKEEADNCEQLHEELDSEIAELMAKIRDIDEECAELDVVIQTLKEDIKE